MVDHKELNNRWFLDYEVHAKLHQLSRYFEFEEFGEALIAMGTKNLNDRADYYKKNPRAKFTKTKLDRLLSGVVEAYIGDKEEQEDLRSLYVKFFVQCFPNLSQDEYFYEQIRRMLLFSADLLKALGLKGWGVEMHGRNKQKTPAKKHQVQYIN